MSSSDEEEYKPMETWTTIELELLLNSLKDGIYDTNQLHKNIPSKTKQQISNAMLYCVSQAVEIAKSSEQAPLEVKKREDYSENEKIVQWLKFISENYDLRKITNVSFADALMAAAEEVKYDGSADFRCIYLYMAKALRGENLPILDNNTRYVLNQCIKESIQAAKHEIKHNKKLKKYLESVGQTDLADVELPDPSDLDINYSYKTIVSKLPFNPLKIPIELLKRSADGDGSSGDEC